MSDTPQEHDEGSHACCNKRLKEEGGKARCCSCEPHDGCDFNHPQEHTYKDKNGNIYAVHDEPVSAPTKQEHEPTPLFCKYCGQLISLCECDLAYKHPTKPTWESGAVAGSYPTTSDISEFMRTLGFKWSNEAQLYYWDSPLGYEYITRRTAERFFSFLTQREKEERERIVLGYRQTADRCYHGQDEKLYQAIKNSFIDEVPLTHSQK